MLPIKMTMRRRRSSTDLVHFTYIARGHSASSKKKSFRSTITKGYKKITWCGHIGSGISRELTLHMHTHTYAHARAHLYILCSCIPLLLPAFHRLCLHIVHSLVVRRDEVFHVSQFIAIRQLSICSSCSVFVSVSSMGLDPGI